MHAIVKFKNGLYKFLYFETDMSIPIGNVLFEKNFELKILNNLNNKQKKIT